MGIICGESAAGSAGEQAAIPWFGLGVALAETSDV